MAKVETRGEMRLPGAMALLVVLSALASCSPHISREQDSVAMTTGERDLAADAATLDCSSDEVEKVDGVSAEVRVIEVGSQRLFVPKDWLRGHEAGAARRGGSDAAGFAASGGDALVPSVRANECPGLIHRFTEIHTGRYYGLILRPTGQLFSDTLGIFAPDIRELVVRPSPAPGENERPSKSRPAGESSPSAWRESRPLVLTNESAPNCEVRRGFMYEMVILRDSGQGVQWGFIFDSRKIEERNWITLCRKVDELFGKLLR